MEAATKEVTVFKDIVSTQTTDVPPPVVPSTVVVPETEKKTEASGGVDDGVHVTADHLRNWLRRCRRKFRNGVIVVKVASTGKLVKRVVHIGAKAEYFEISSAKLFDIGYHMSDIESVVAGTDSADFAAYLTTNPEKLPKAEKSCVVKVESRPVSLVFKDESDRRDFMFLMRVEQRAIRGRYAAIAQKFADRQAASTIEAAA